MYGSHLASLVQKNINWLLLTVFNKAFELRYIHMTDQSPSLWNHTSDPRNVSFLRRLLKQTFLLLLLFIFF